MSSMDGIAAESGPWVCIVDGSSDDRADTRRLFLTGAERQYRFTEAATGAAGVQMILAHPPDCLLLSCNLPDLDALGVLAALADSFGFVICPVVVLTGATGLATEWRP